MKLHRMNDELVAFHCPGCDCAHQVRVSAGGWQWNGSMESPTFAPSVLVQSGHYAPGRSSDQCWCTYNAAHSDKPAPFKCSVCHSLVADGMIQFLGDCTHALAGQRVAIPEWAEQ